MKNIKFLFFLFSCQLIGLACEAQQADSKPVMSELMRSNGRIYVVVAVILTIFAGLILYLVRLEKKISKIEKEK